MFSACQHAGSLYTEGVFEKKDGDRGANSISTKQRQNMHALWDQISGKDFALRTIRLAQSLAVSSRRTLVMMNSQPRELEVRRNLPSLPLRSIPKSCELLRECALAAPVSIRRFVASAHALAGFKSHFCNDAKSYVQK